MTKPTPVARTALEQYNTFMAEGEEPSAVERLRFFCSLAMKGQDWLDVEPFFEVVEAQLNQARADALREAIKVVETYRVSVGNSAAGELAAEWTMENLREIREELRRMADEIEGEKK